MQKNPSFTHLCVYLVPGFLDMYLYTYTTSGGDKFFNKDQRFLGISIVIKSFTTTHLIAFYGCSLSMDKFDMNIDTRICAGILIDIVRYINQGFVQALTQLIDFFKA